MVQMEKHSEVKNNLKRNWPIYLLILLSLILHLLCIKELGYDYTLDSDDKSYVMSGITFLESGKITMHGVMSAQIMPGMTFLIAFVALIFGTGWKLWLALKVLWMFMGIMTIVVVYKTIKYITNNRLVSTIPCIFFLLPEYLWMDNVILTETPFILLFSLLIYHTIKIADNHQTKEYIKIVTLYILALFIRPNIVIYPAFLIIYLLFKKYDIKLLIKQVAIAFGVLLLILIPWTYRNYKVFNKFIPLTYGSGNPLLLGTYQGSGYPTDEEMDYSYVDEKMSDEMKYYLDNPNEKDYMTKYYSLEKDNMIAKYRMKVWWENNPVSMLKSYFIWKPLVMIDNYFYWKEVLGIGESFLNIVTKVEIAICALSVIAIIKDRKHVKELIFLLLMIASQVMLYSYTFAFSRYAITLFFMRYIIIGVGISVIAKRRR